MSSYDIGLESMKGLWRTAETWFYKRPENAKGTASAGVKAPGLNEL